MANESNCRILAFVTGAMLLVPCLAGLAAAEDQPYSGSDGIIVDYSSIKTSEPEEVDGHTPYDGCYFFMVEFTWTFEGDAGGTLYMDGYDFRLAGDWEWTKFQVPGSNLWVDKPVNPKVYRPNQGRYTVQVLFEVEEGIEPAPNYLCYQGGARWSLEGANNAGILLIVGAVAAIAVVAVIVVVLMLKGVIPGMKPKQPIQPPQQQGYQDPYAIGSRAPKKKKWYEK
jgi:hypothetical protein